MFNYENREYLEHLKAKTFTWYEDMLQEVLACRPGSVLELGCGDGGFTRLLADRGVNVLALDYSRTFLAYARRQTTSRLVRYKQANLDGAQGFALPRGRFDVIVSIDVLEHLRHKERLLESVADALADGGALVLQAPNLYCNLVSQNYVHSPANMLRKLLRAVSGSWRHLTRRQPADVTGVRYGIDYKFADHDAVWLASPFWFLDFFRRRGWQVDSFTSFSYDSEKKWLKRLFRLAGRLPFVRHLGGRMIFVVRRPAGSGSKLRRKAGP